MSNFKEYIDRLYPHLNWAATRYAAIDVCLQKEDLIRDGLEALWKVWNRYDEKEFEELCTIGHRAVLNQLLYRTRWSRGGKGASFQVEMNENHGANGFEEAIHLKLDLERFAGSLSDLGQKVFQEILDPSDETLQVTTAMWADRGKYQKWKEIEALVYAQSLGVNPEMVTKALKEVKKKVKKYAKVHLLQVGGIMKRHISPDPMDFVEGAPVPGVEAPEEEAWVPVPTTPLPLVQVLFDPPEDDEPEAWGPEPSREQIEAEEQHEAGKETEVIIDLDNIPEVAPEDLSKLGEQDETPMDLTPEERARVERKHGPAGKGTKRVTPLKAGSKLEKVWDWLQPSLEEGPITREQIRSATSCALDMDKEKATKWARWAVEDLRKKGLLIRVERNKYQRAQTEGESHAH